LTTNTADTARSAPARGHSLPAARRTAGWLLACVMCLAVMGLIAGVSTAAPGEAWSKLSLHCLHLGMGLAAFLACFSLPVDAVRKAIPGLIVLTVILLVGMLVTDSIGERSKGAERWLSIGGFRFQPSVMLQCLWPVVLSSWAARDPLRLRQPRELWRMMFGFAVLMVPVLLQPDLGSVLILLGVSGMTLFFAGAPLRFLRLLVPVSVAALLIAIFLFDHVDSRLKEFLHGSSYQIERAEEAFAAGGLGGRGPGEGLLKHGYVPEGETDFILALVAEEWGLGGTVLLWGLFVALTVFGVRLAQQADTRYGAILMASATLMIAVQAALNMAVVTGAVPPKGLPLPFVSRGGSSILALSALLGLALKAALEARRSRKCRPGVVEWTASNVLAS